MKHLRDRSTAGWNALVTVSLAIALFGGERPASAAAAQQQNHVVIELFVRSDSQQSKLAKEFLSDLAQRREGVRLKTYDVLSDRDALARLWQLAKRFGQAQPQVPSAYLCDRLFVGFRDGRALEDCLTIRAYVREGCMYCRNARAFLAGLQSRWPAVRVVYYDVVRDASAQRRLNELARAHGKLTIVPSFLVAGRLITGFRGTNITGKEIEQIFMDRSAAASPPRTSTTQSGQFRGNARASLLLPVVYRGGGLGMLDEEARPPPPKAAVDGNRLPDESQSRTDGLPLPPEAPPTETPLTDDLPLPGEAPSGQPLAPPHTSPVTPRDDTGAIEVPGLGKLRVGDWGLPAFTFLIGLIDGFNPCAMWVLVFLLSILVNVRDRRKIVLIAGTFVLVSGLAYFAFMAAWLNVFRVIGLQRPVQVALGALAVFIGTVNIKDFVAFRKGLSLSIPESAKPGIYRRVRNIVATQYITVALFGAVVLAVLVNIIELFCTAGLPALYTEILTLQQLPAWANYSYLALYNVAYMFDDTLLLIVAVVTLSHRKMQEREGRWLKLLSGVVILAIGLVMLLAPDWLG